MKSSDTVSLPVVRRLPRYYRFLCDLKKSGIVRISSKELAKQMNLTASQIRQDLNCFGGFGQQGYGYNVDQLAAEIERILCLDNCLPTILIGVGNLGRALSSFLYDAKGIRLIGLFDKSPKNVMDINPELKVMSTAMLDEFCAEHHPRVAILCIPGEHAQPMAQKLVSLGIEGFWNFTHVDLRLDDSICVENVHLGDSLMTLCYNINTNGGQQ
ncbi:MAG: redox-sensing transcriptional repressor Rex [Oscillospiraceae bacterium]|nr:redox-sensing transcriptional repressor Rex [Oscillospiraceae bacterium]